MKAGLTRDIATVSFGRPGIAILKFCALLFTTRYGPVYGEASED